MTRIAYALADIGALFAILMGLGGFFLWLASGISTDLRILIYIAFGVFSFFWSALAATIGVPPAGFGRPIRIFSMMRPDAPRR